MTRTLVTQRTSIITRDLKGVLKLPTLPPEWTAWIEQELGKPYVPGPVDARTLSLLLALEPEPQRRLRYGEVYDVLPGSAGELPSIRALAREYGVENLLRYDPETREVFLDQERVPYAVGVGDRTYGIRDDFLEALRRVRRPPAPVPTYGIRGAIPTLVQPPPPAYFPPYADVETVGRLRGLLPEIQRRIVPGEVYEELPGSRGPAMAYEPMVGIRALARKHNVEHLLRYDPLTRTVWLGHERLPYTINIGGRTYAPYRDVEAAMRRAGQQAYLRGSRGL